MSTAAADIPDELALAVEALVEAYGPAGAEDELEDRLGGELDDRVLAALAYLRRQYPQVTA